MTTICVSPMTVWQDPPDETCTATIPWPLDLSCCCTLPDDVDPDGELVLMLKAAAVQIMIEATCRIYTCGVQRVRPCVNCSCGFTCLGLCEYRYIDLTMWGRGPVQRVTAVVVDGVAVPTTDYWIEGNRLIPLRGGALWCWPNQDRNLPVTDEGTWYVEYVSGKKPPEIVVQGAVDLTCQLVKWCTNQPCDLPANAVSVSREGVTISLETGLKSLPTVKLAIETFGNCDKFRASRLIDPVNFGSVL